MYRSVPLKLGIVVPCFNEEDVLPETNARLIALLAQMRDIGLIKNCSAIFYVDDGSQDNTWSIIEQLSDAYSEVCGIKLSRNCGHQSALLCGLMTALGDALISVDMGRAEIAGQDLANRTASLVLPAPTVLNPRVDHHRTITYHVNLKRAVEPSRMKL